VGFYTLSIIQYSKNREHKILKLFFFLSSGALSKGPNIVVERVPVVEKLCSIVLRIPDDGHSSKSSNSECYTSRLY
jgi:hypothetical protein